MQYTQNAISALCKAEITVWQAEAYLGYRGLQRRQRVKLIWPSKLGSGRALRWVA